MPSFPNALAASSAEILSPVSRSTIAMAASRAAVPTAALAVRGGGDAGIGCRHGVMRPGVGFRLGLGDLGVQASGGFPRPGRWRLARAAVQRRLILALRTFPHRPRALPALGDGAVDGAPPAGDGPH